MSNTLLNISMITREATRVFKNSVSFTKNVNRQYDDQFAVKGAKVGATINVRKPAKFKVSNGAALVIQDVTDRSVPLVLDQRKHVAFQFTAQDLTLSIDDFSKRYIEPAVVPLANEVDRIGLSLMYKQVFNQVGTVGTPPATIAVPLAAGQKLDEFATPMDGRRSLILNPAGQAGIVGGFSALFNSQKEIADQYRRGRMGSALGFDWAMDQNIPVHTVGALGGTPLADGSGTLTGASISSKGWTAAASNRLKAGDVITFASVNAVNPITKADTGSLMQFVVTSDFNSDGSGNGAIGISPAIVTTGVDQNVTAAPVDGAAIQTFGAVSSTGGKATPVNLAYHEDAFIMGSADLELPRGVDMASRVSDAESGISIRIVRDYDINNDVFPCRLDILFGWLAANPEWACRIQG